MDDTRKFFGPVDLLASVESGAVALLRGRWVIELHARGGKLQRRQDLPAEAFFDARELRRLVAALGNDWGLLLVALSYVCALRLSRVAAGARRSAHRDRFSHAAALAQCRAP